MQAFHIEELKRLALDMISGNLDIKGQDHKYYDDYFTDENFLNFMENYGHASLDLYNEDDKEKRLGYFLGRRLYGARISSRKKHYKT